MPTVSTRVDALLWPTVFDQLKQLLAGFGGSILFADLAIKLEETANDLRELYE
jgi:hypothetical protein